MDIGRDVGVTKRRIRGWRGKSRRAVKHRASELKV